MAQYLVDTNVFLRAAMPSSAQHAAAVGSLTKLARRGDTLFLAPQVVVEFWAAATRPVNVNGYGWTTVDAEAETVKLVAQFPLLPESQAIFPDWHRLVIQYHVSGKRTYDARLVAIMRAYGVHDLLTFNVDDFRSLPVNAVSPDEILKT